MIYYALFPYNFYYRKRKIAQLSVDEKFIQKLRCKFPEIIFEEVTPSEDTIVIYDSPISDIPSNDLVEMIAAWAGGRDKVKKVASKFEFQEAMEKLNEDLKRNRFID